MPECHICGRATVIDRAESDLYASNLNICTRARCDPERRFHEKQRNSELMEHWAIINRFKEAAEASELSADGGRVVEPIETCRECSREAVRGGLCMGHWREHERDLIGDGGIICLAVSPPGDRAPPGRPKPIGPIRRRWHRLVERLHGWVEPDRPSPPGRDDR